MIKRYSSRRESISDSLLNNKLKKEVVAAEKEKIVSLKKLKRKIKTERDFHNWFFHEHKAYTFYKDTFIINSNLSKIY